MPKRRRGTDYERLAQTVQFGLPDGMTARPVRRWTVDKLAILAYYLPSFASICQANAQGWYFLDGFAGSGVNVVAGETWYKGSALIGLSATPQAQAALLIEKNAQASQALEVRARAYSLPVHIATADCNAAVPQLLPEVFANRHRPAFCVLDPEGLELTWNTVETVAKHRFPQYSPYELMIYFSTPGVSRVGGKIVAGHEQYRRSLGQLFGPDNREWENVAERHELGQLNPGQAGAMYREIYSNQVRRPGYEYVIPRPVRSPTGNLVTI